MITNEYSSKSSRHVQIIDSHNNSNRIMRALNYSILIMLLPVIISLNAIKNNNILVYLYAIFYIIQLLVLLGATIQLNPRFLRMTIIAWTVYSCILMVPLMNSSILGENPHLYDMINTGIKIINFFMFFCVMASVKIKEEEFIDFINRILIFSVISCFYAIIVDIQMIAAIPNASNIYNVVVKGFFGNRNQFAAFIFISVIANLYSYISSKNKTLNYLLLLVQIFCLLVTFSRAGIASVVILLVVYITISRNNIRKSVLFIAATVVAIFFIMNTKILNFILNNYLRLSVQDSGRLNLWYYAIDIIKESKFLGIGFYNGVEIAMNKGMELTQFHNMYFDVLVGGGLLELAFIVFTLYFVIYRLKKGAFKREYFQVYISGVVAFLTYAIMESVSLFSLSYGDTLYTIFMVSLPLLLSRASPNRDMDR